MRRAFTILLILAATALAAAIPPSNPNTIPEARKLLTYLQNLGGQGMLSGQLSMLNEAIDDTTFRERYQIERNGGRMPAIYAANLGDWPMNYQDSIVRTILHKWKKSAGQLVVMLCWHTVQPDAFEDSGYAVMSRFSATSPYPSWKVDSILKPGTALNIEYMKRLTQAGKYLQRLDSAGIPVIWRPYHENNGAFFWWGQQPRFKDLWKQMYRYYTDSLRLNNLLWAYSTCGFGEGDKWVDSLYPGHAYVDILGADIYSSNFDQNYQPWIYQTLLAKAEGRPLGITESGMMPYVPLLKYTQPKWAFFCTWWGFEVDTMWVNAYYHPAGYSLQNSDARYKAVYDDPYTITREQIDFDLKPSARVFLSTGVSPAGSGSVRAVPDSMGRYTKGQNLSVTAIPKPGWVFMGWAGDASGTTNPLPLSLDADRSVRATFAALKGTNLLLNGSFNDSLLGWDFLAWQPGATATTTVEGPDSVFHVDVTGKGADPWGIQILQGLRLEKGTTYSFSCQVHGAVGSKISYAVGLADGTYAKIYSGADTLRSTETCTIEATFVDTLPSESSLRLEFNLGAQLGSLWIDNVKIARLTGDDPVVGIATPARRSFRPNLRASRGTLEWTAAQPLSLPVVLHATSLDGRALGEIALPAGARSGRITAPWARGTFLLRQVGADVPAELFAAP